jgi:hypothetical protein
VSTVVPSLAWTCETVIGVPATYGPADSEIERVGTGVVAETTIGEDCQAPRTAATWYVYAVPAVSTVSEHDVAVAATVQTVVGEPGLSRTTW